MKVFVTVAGCLLIVAFGVWSQPVLRVQTGSSIQAAIDRAAPGAVIELGPGSWEENLRITKPVTINGAGADRTTISARSSGYPVIWITSPQTGSVTLVGITVSGAFGDGCAEMANKVCADGVLIQGGMTVELANCLIIHNALHGLYAAGTAKLALEATTVAHNYSGIWLSGAAGARVDNTLIANNRFGLVLGENSSAQVNGCTVVDNDADGVLVADAADLALFANRIAGNGRTGVCVDEWPCYRTQRAFTGTIRGGRNTVSAPQGSRAAAVCPAALRFLTADAGGIYPAPDPSALFADIAVSPPLEGIPDAPVTIIEFSDFTCPYCARFARDVLPRLRKDYIDTGKVRLFFIPFPVHGETARKEAEAGFCAQAQGRFWAFHDQMFADLLARGFPEKFDVERVRAVAVKAGCDAGQIASCLSAGTYTSAVQEATTIAHRLGVDGTPSFFIDGAAVFGLAPYAVFARMIDAELALDRSPAHP